MDDLLTLQPSSPPLVTRRAFCATAVGAVVGATLLPSASAAARRRRSKVRDVYRGRRGTTLWLDLDSAPFPHKGERYNDPTVIVFVPHYFRVYRDYRVDTIVHFHGFRDTADAAMKRHQLREQLADSKQNAIIVFPQGAVKAEDPSFGKLDEPRGLLRLLTELRKTLQSHQVAASLGPAGIPRRARIGKCILSAHSGGYRAVSHCLEHGGYNVDEVYLFDALYGRVSIFRDWLAETWFTRLPRRDRHKLISYFEGNADTAHENRRLMAELKRLKIPYVHEEREGELSRRQLTQSRAVFIHTRVSHQGVLFRTNAMRDCLFASGLQRHLKSKWFERADGPRVVNQRKP